MTSLSVEAFCTIPTNLFPNKGVSLTFLQSFVNLPAMNTPMIQLLYPKMEPEVLEKMDLISLRSLAKELRVHSSLNGTDEFAMYDDETILREDWISAVNAPPTTTTHVNICIVKPATLLKHGSYADTIISNGSNPEWVNTPTDFISHAWRYNFKDLVNAIKNEADERDRNLILRGELPITNQRYYWNDIFVEDQNATLSKPDGYFFHSFRTAIITIGRTILILMPLKKAIPLTRAWCVWEMFCSIAAENVELCIALPPSERIVLEEMLMNEFEEIINIMTNVQIEKSQAFLTEDQNEIHRIVNEQCTNGYNGVNTIICNGLRNWLIETSELLLQRQGDGGIDNKIGAEGVNSGVEGDGDAKGKVDCKLQFQEGEESEKRLELMNQIGKMLHEQNRYVKAETLYREVLHRRQLLLGNDHIDTLASMNNLIKLLLDLNKNLNEVEILLHESLEIEEIKYGLIHSATLITITSLGTFSLHQDNLDAAERYFRRALRGWELINKTEGNGDNEDDLNILTSVNNLSFVLQRQGKLDLAEPLNRRVLEGREKLLGEDHPNTLTSANNLVLLLKEQGKIDEAVPICQNVVNGLEKALGSNNHMTLNAIGNLGLLYIRIDDEEQKQKGHKQVLNILKKLKQEPHSLPDSHPWIIKFEKALENLL